MVKVTVPVRVDLGGGVSDIPEFKEVTGTFITNLGLDLYLNGKKIQIEIRLKKSSKSTVSYNQKKIFPSNIKKDSNLITKLFLFLEEKYFQKEHLSLIVTNPLPSQTGLG